MLGLVDLPPPHERVVIGTWKLVEPDCKVTRSIESCQGKLFLVSRTTDESGRRSGGTVGIVLEEVSQGGYQGTGDNKSRYIVNENGELHMYVQGDSVPSMRAVPHPELWAE